MCHMQVSPALRSSEKAHQVSAAPGGSKNSLDPEINIHITSRGSMRQQAPLYLAPPSAHYLGLDMSPWTLQQVSQHNSEKSCWVIIHNKVYDVTDFLPEHPGGQDIILKYAGRDATAVYVPIHPKDALEKNLSPSKHLGVLDQTSIDILHTENHNRKMTNDELRVERSRKTMPPLSRILNLKDIEAVAREVLSYKAYAYYSSAADDEITYSENGNAFSRFFFRARVLRPVAHCDPSTTILGYKSSIPVFVSASGLAKLGHPDGEINITKGAFKAGVIQMVSSNASFSQEEIAHAAEPSQTLFFQLYKNRDDNIAEKRVRAVEKLGYKAIFLTVDAVVASNRERDIRSPWVLEEQDHGPVYYQPDAPQAATNMLATAGALVANDDRDMTWEKTIPWLRRISSLPIVIKGIQCVEDAVLAAEAGVDGILISNHGGRQLDYSLPSMEVLYQLRQQRPDVFENVEVYIDGGVRRGTDVVKAICLGAKAVGLGRPFLYAQSAYGVHGVCKVVEILQREIITAMRLAGASNVNDLCPEMLHRAEWHVPARAKL